MSSVSCKHQNTLLCEEEAETSWKSRSSKQKPATCWRLSPSPHEQTAPDSTRGAWHNPWEEKSGNYGTATALLASQQLRSHQAPSAFVPRSSDAPAPGQWTRQNGKVQRILFVGNR